MFSFYKNLPISTKLFLSNLAFALPMAVLIFFMNISFTYDISIGQKELAGTTTLRPLFSLLSHIPQYYFGEESKKSSEHEQVTSLFTQMQHSGNSNLYNELQEKWLSLQHKKNNLAEQEQIQAHILELISLAGKNSMLTLDPAMDSNLLAGLLVAQIPRNSSQLNKYFFMAETPNNPISTEGVVAFKAQSSREFQHDFSLFQADFEKIIADARMAIQEDRNYYGVSPSLQNNFAQLLEEYRHATAQFMELHRKSSTEQVDRAEYLAANSKARVSCRQLFQSGIEELDILITKRIASYRKWQALGFICSALAVLLASALIYTIARSITAPIKAVIGYTRQISSGDHEARLSGDFQGEFKGLVADLKKMVHEIIRLASFPRENPNPVLASDSSGAITYLNHSAEALLEKLQIRVEAFLPPDHGQIIEACLASDRNRLGIELQVGDDFFEWNYHPLTEQGIVHIYAKDITARKKLEEQLRHDAFHDSLTGLANRALFLDRLQHAIARSKTDPHAAFAVLFLDLDGFKLINDSLGHEQGDKLLVAFAERMTPLFHPGDTLARLGGDEFTLLLDNITNHQTLAIPERIQQALEKPFSLGELEFSISASIGIVIQPAPELGAEEILRDADTAMYRAKAQGRGKYVLFDPSMHNLALERLRLEIELKKAIERQEFVVFYQPIVDLVNGALIGFEALVRWQHPTQGLLSPGQFIPLAEKTGLIIAIGRDVLMAACHQAKFWQEKFDNHKNLLISVNLAVAQLLSSGIMDEIDHILKHSGLPPATLKLEVTESGIMENIETAIDVLHAIKQRGIALSIDDFGTGYSSLSYLHRFPFDTLKVDQSFVSEMEKDAKNLEIIRGIVGLAHNLEKKVIVEGIETEPQLAQVKAMGCEYGQGYLFAKPLPMEQAEELLRSPKSFP
ncbi:MAG: EAL domain-containing protein [Proteobacteria bacterium]|nr:EAL domain-containing protein [Pseudomonadota bacterium]